MVQQKWSGCCSFHLYPQPVSMPIQECNARQRGGLQAYACIQTAHLAVLQQGEKPAWPETSGRVRTL